MIVIEKMSAGEIEAANGTDVLRSSPGHHDQTLIETGTIEIGEIGNAPIVRDRFVIDPIASGSPAHLDRQHRAIALDDRERQDRQGSDRRGSNRVSQPGSSGPDVARNRDRDERRREDWQRPDRGASNRERSDRVRRSASSRPEEWRNNQGEQRAERREGRQNRDESQRASVRTTRQNPASFQGQQVRRSGNSGNNRRREDGQSVRSHRPNGRSRSFPASFQSRALPVRVKALGRKVSRRFAAGSPGQSFLHG